MNLTFISPRKALSPSYLRLAVQRTEIEQFKVNLTRLFNSINEQESEEHLKNIVAEFLKDTYYKSTNEINTKDRKDLVIYKGETAASHAVVLIETKKPTNKSEMVSMDKPNAKALQELILYYLRETLETKNHEIRYLIATNIWEWYIFDEVWFEKKIFRNSKLVEQYQNWKVSGHDTRYFYEHIAATFLDSIEDTIECTYFNLKEYQPLIENQSNQADTDLSALYKIFSPEHLLKKPFANDGNTLDESFYNELLHIMGLTEVAMGGKRLIQRKSPKERNSGSFLENTISKLIVNKKLEYLENSTQFGDNEDEQLFSIALELCITWLNRILFLKLLEGQLIKYHRKNFNYSFLTSQHIRDFDELEELFFEVLAIKPENRTKSVIDKFGNLPYLNSSLFDISELELKTVQISNLKNRLELPIYETTVLKDVKGKSIVGKKNSLTYLLEFLDAYDFANDSAEQIQEQNKTIINSAVLGLIFEKLNGYSDGSFFTPAFITMYICRDAIRKAVVQKFNEEHNFGKVDSFEQLKERIDGTNPAQRQQCNAIINSLKICDPAVGSGHFLVTALNEIIAIKHDLQILSYIDGSRMKGYTLLIENDEIVITDNETNQLFEYRLNQNNKIIDDLQKVQMALFHEKQTIIENCLFGVDINAKSVMICQLRLWIELLKNAYYIATENNLQLQTLPNIDINIKCGNSLVSRFALNDKNNFLPKNKTFIKELIIKYKSVVSRYKTVLNSASKGEFRKEIAQIKREFENFSMPNDKEYAEFRLKQYQLSQSNFGFSEDESNRKDLLNNELSFLEQCYKDKQDSVYGKAFEWRFEFPEVLNEEGDFVGFDVVVGNPPYLSYYSGMAKEISPALYRFYVNNYEFVENKKAKNRIGTVMLFLELSTKIVKPKGEFCSIIDLNIFSPAYQSIRKYLNNKVTLNYLLYNISVFDKVGSGQALLSHTNEIRENSTVQFINGFTDDVTTVYQSDINESNNYSYFIDNTKPILDKIRENTVDFEEVAHIISGMNIGGVKDYFLSETRKNENYHTAILSGNIFRYQIDYPNEVQLSDKRKHFITFDKEIERYIVDNKLGTPGLGANDERFKKEKLLLRRPLTADGRLSAAYSNNPDHYSDVTVYIVNEKTQKLKYLLAIINSKLASFYCQKTGIIRNQKGQQPQITINQFKKFPIKQLSESKQQAFIKIVDKILENKSKGLETKDLEDKIDTMIYQLYQLEKEEIDTIEKFL